MKYLHKGKWCTVKVLTKDNLPLLMNVAEDVFDHPIDKAFADEFLNDPRHHVVVAAAKDKIIGFVSAVHYIHPDKPPELWINEIAVAPPYQGHGLGTAILNEMLQLGKGIGCKNAWVWGAAAGFSFRSRRNRLRSAATSTSSPSPRVSITSSTLVLISSSVRGRDSLTISPSRCPFLSGMDITWGRTVDI